MTLKSSQVAYITIEAENDQQRVDNFLFTILKGVPRSKIYHILRKGEVRVNKKRVKAAYKLNKGDIVRIPPIRVAERDVSTVATKVDRIANFERNILYEDSEIMALNKPSGIAVHGGSGLNFGVIELLRALRPDSKFLELVHRIDRKTSGLLLIAKKRSALRLLHQQFRSKEIEKIYLALVRGQWPSSCTMIKAPLVKNVLQGGERVVKISSCGKPAETRFCVEERFATATLLRAVPLTGRTHQIRVHTQYAHHPIAFDERYGDSEFDRKLRTTGLNRLFLHALQLKFVHPKSGEQMVLSAPLDDVLQHCLQKLREKHSQLIKLP